jgi:hypothetical protein
MHVSWLAIGTTLNLPALSIRICICQQLGHLHGLAVTAAQQVRRLELILGEEPLHGE